MNETQFRKMLLKRSLRIVGFAFIVAMITGIAFHLPLDEWIPQSRDWFNQQGAWGMLLYGVCFIVLSLLFVPSSILMIGSGLLFGWLGGSLLSSISCMVAVTVSFWIVRYIGRNYLLQRFVKSRYFQVTSYAIGSRGAWIIGLLRLTPIPFGVGNCLYSLSPVSFKPYFIASWLGLLPGNIIFGYVGFAGGPLLFSREKTSSTTPELALILIGILVSLGIGWYVSRRAARYLRESGTSLA